MRSNNATPGPRRQSSSSRYRTLLNLAAVTVSGKYVLPPVHAQAAVSERVDPPTLATLQQCDTHQLNHLKARLMSQNDYSPGAALLCVDEHTHDRYQSLRTPEALTNCYGDAIGIADRVNPGGTFHGDANDCDTLIDGALKDGAVRPKDTVCPDYTRQMQFFITEDRRDYHVISRGAGDASWMNKYTGTPRFPVTISDPAAPELPGDNIMWIVRNDNGKVWVNNQHPKDYPIRCPQILCSLPEKVASAKSDL